MDKLKASWLAYPLIGFIVVTLIVPLFGLLRLSVWDTTVRDTIPLTAAALQSWDEAELPNKETFNVLAQELIVAQEERSAGRLATRVNRIVPRSRALIGKTARHLGRQDTTDWQSAMIDIDDEWADVAIWRGLKQTSQPFSWRNLLQAVDLKVNSAGEVESVPETQSIYLTLFKRTLYVSFIVTVLCLLIGYPMAYTMAHVKPNTARILLVLVLIPFWTSLLVRTTSWLVLLQQQGVLNDLFVAVGLVDDNDRITMVHNLTGTLVAMTQVLLPFMILPLYSVMASIPESFSKASASLGANPLQSFARVYFPQSLPGVAAGGLLVFILSIGYYITPALVGGSKGQLISNMIAYHLQTTLNWGLAAALSTILLIGVMILYLIYDRWVGIDRMKLG